MLLPIASFGYAHMYDSVEKKYRLHIGTMYANITYFHVDHARMIDKNNDGVLWSTPAQPYDELNITVWEDDCTWKVYIYANACPDFVLNTTMHITNVGDLPWTVTWIKTGTTYWPLWGNSTDDPGWDTEPTKVLDPPTNPMWPSALWSWEILYFKDNSSKIGMPNIGRFPATPTQHVYKPGDKLVVKQHINLRQPDTTEEALLYKKIMGSWFYIWEIFTFETEDTITGSSWTFGDSQGID
jgi:hypothetical protein